MHSLVAGPTRRLLLILLEDLKGSNVGQLCMGPVHRFARFFGHLWSNEARFCKGWGQEGAASALTLCP